jgi:hypothetical protein
MNVTIHIPPSKIYPFDLELCALKKTYISNVRGSMVTRKTQLPGGVSIMANKWCIICSKDGWEDMSIYVTRII